MASGDYSWDCHQDISAGSILQHSLGLKPSEDALRQHFHNHIQIDLISIAIMTQAIKRW